LFLPVSLLLVLALRRVLWQWRHPRTLDPWSLAAALALAASFAVGLWWSLFPKVAQVQARSALLSGIQLMATSPVAFLLAGALLLLAGPRWFKGGAGRTLGGLLVAGSLTWAGLAWVKPVPMAPMMHYNLRMLNLLLPLALGLLPFLASRWRTFRPTFDAKRRLIFAGFALGVLAWQVGSCRAWLGYTTRFSKVLEASRGYVRYADAGLTQVGFDWSWTMPNMSILLQGLQGRPVTAVVLTPVWYSWQPFDPRIPEQRPRLGRHGVRYALPVEPEAGQ
jgi:hypothetical protein